MKTLILPILLITFGVGWLLTTLGVVPEIDWVWTLGIAIVGILALGLGGIDKVTIVVGPIFLLASFLSILRQTDRLRIDLEVPILIIAIGVLMMVAQLSGVAPPDWLVHAHEEPNRDNRNAS